MEILRVFGCFVLLAIAPAIVGAISRFVTGPLVSRAIVVAFAGLYLALLPYFQLFRASMLAQFGRVTVIISTIFAFIILAGTGIQVVSLVERTKKPENESWYQCNNCHQLSYKKVVDETGCCPNCNERTSA